MRTRVRRTLKKTKPAMPPVFRRFGALWLFAYMLYIFFFAGLVLLPVGYPWLLENPQISSPFTVEKAVFGAFSEENMQKVAPLQSVINYMHAQGIRPHRLPWKPSGVDYGNTAMRQATGTGYIYLAWQYRPKTLDAVPPGVNVLAPTWFYVEDDNGLAVVNDLANLLDGKLTAWDPVQYVTAAHAGGAQVWASVVSMTPKLSKQVVTDAARRVEFVSRLAQWVRQYKLDGINFDFEDMDPADKEEYTAFIAQCKQSLPAGAVVSVDVTVPLKNPSPTNWWQCYDREGLGRVADYIAVMAYDNPDLEPVAAIAWVNGKMADMLALVPAEKILMGVPFYGVDFWFDVPEGSGSLIEMPAFDKSKARKTMTPSGLQSLIDKGYYSSGGKKIELDYWVDMGSWREDKGMKSYAFVDKNGVLHLIYCEDAQSLRLKGGVLALNRLGGTAVWRMEFGRDDLWEALSQGMTGITAQ